MTITYCMDCMDFLRTQPDKYFDLIISDPPYRNENQPTKTMRRTGKRMRDFGQKPGAEFFEEIKRVGKHWIVFGANNFPELGAYKGFIVWRKTNIPLRFTMSAAEIAAISEGLGTTAKVIEAPSCGTKENPRIHPTQKPIALYEWIFATYAKPGWLVLDTHLGSGSSRIAADQMGLSFMGTEINPEYFAAQEERYAAYQAQMKIVGR